MKASIWKWIAALLTGAAYAAAASVTAAVGEGGPTGNVALDGLIVALVTRAVGWAVAKIPATA